MTTICNTLGNDPSLRKNRFDAVYSSEQTNETGTKVYYNMRYQHRGRGMGL